jgi:hypothetical protein
LDPEPAVVTTASVRWMYFGSDPLNEPFFLQTVDKIREDPRRQIDVETSTDALFRLTETLPEVSPAGFIFHISHCGSTLISNALRTAPSTVVAAEATPFVRLARWYPEAPQRYLAERWQRTRRCLFEATFRSFAHYHTGETERLVVKFSSLNLFAMRFVRQCWPQTPCVVVVRDPLAVLVSSLNEAGWLGQKSEPGQPEALYGWRDTPQPFAEMKNEEFCARLLGRHLEAALEAVDDGCKVIDYEDLNPKRMREIAEFFGLKLPDEPERIKQVFSGYSKDPAKATPFRDDRAMKRRLASRAAVDAATKWAMPAYVELRGRGAW